MPLYRTRRRRHLPHALNGGKEFDDVKRPTQTFYNTDVALEPLSFSTVCGRMMVAMIAGLSSRISANQEMGMAQGNSVWAACGFRL